MKVAVAGFHEGLAGQVSSWLHLALLSVDLVCFLHPFKDPPVVSSRARESRASARFQFPDNGYYRGQPLIHGEDWAEALRTMGATHVINAIPDPSEREAFFFQAQSAGFLVPALVHPSAIVLSDAVIGEGSLLEPLTYVGLGAEIGLSCHLHTGSVVEHNSVINDFVTLNPRATVAGNVRIGRKSVINMSSSISNGVVLGEDTIVGASSLVLKSYTAPGLRLLGSPATPG